jgi:hypothetical protein
MAGCVRKLCEVYDCYNIVLSKGLCKKHGAPITKCKKDCCNRDARYKGLCVHHGGTKRCSTQNCTKIARSGGKCWKHGERTECSVEGCSNTASSNTAIANGRCRKHRTP